MTTQPQINADPEQNRSKNSAEDTVTTDTPGAHVPLDKSSPEWRSQFGVLPSAQRSQRAPIQTRGVAQKQEKKSPASFFLGALAVLGVGGIIAYGYMPSRQKTEPKPEKPKSGKSVVAISSGSTVKKLRDAVKNAPPSAATPAAKPTAQPTPWAVRPSASPAKQTAHPAAKATPRPLETPEPRKPTATPPPHRAAPKAPVNRAAPASPPAVAQAAPRPQQKPASPKPEPVKAVVKPKPKPTLHPLPEIPPPHQEGIESDGTNPLDIPR